MTQKLVGRLAGRSAAVAGAVALAVMLAPAAADAAPTGLYVGNYEGNTISEYTIGSTGALSPSGSVATGTYSYTMAATPNGKYVYATNNGDGTVSQYAVGSGGTLTPLSPATVASGAGPTQVAVSPDGKNVYVANDGGSVTVYTVGSDGTLTLVSTVTTDLSSPTGLAISPDGRSVYVGDQNLQQVVEFDRSSDGSLTPKSTSSISTSASNSLWLAITPNGKYVYASGSSSYGNSSSLIDEYVVGSGGELTAQPAPSVPEGVGNYQVTVSPNGQNLYASSCNDNAVYQYSIGSTGELAPLTPASVTSGGTCPEMQWMTANGAHLYAPDYGGSGNGDVSQFNVSSTGALTLMSPATVPAGAGANDVIIPPDQGPVAKFGDTAKGQTVLFNASKSSDSDGKVVSYHWSFGDGHSLTTRKTKVSHSYKKAGKHKVTLTVTDDSGCSLTQVFTGQTAYCNGGSAARTSHRVKVTTAKSLRVQVTPNRAQAGQRTCYAFRATSGGHGVSKVMVKLASHTTKTGSTGNATLCLTLRKGTYTARASKSGYRSATAAVRVTAAPAFTG